MLFKTHNPTAILRLIGIVAPVHTYALVAMRVNDSGYFIASCEMLNEDTGELSQLAVCLYLEGSTLCAAYGFGAAPLEFAHYAHALSGAPMYKLYKAQAGPLPRLPEWARNEEIEANSKRKPCRPLTILVPGSLQELSGWILEEKQNQLAS